jgi:phosphoglycolate phosphatase
VSEVTATTLRCFDLDGCVVDSDRAIADGLQHALAHIGLPMPDAEGVRAAIGPPLLTTFRGLLTAAGQDPDAEEGAVLLRAAVDAYRVRYAAVGFELTHPIEGMVELLERMRSAEGVTSVIVTAKPTAVAEPLLAHVGLRGLFDGVYGAPLGPDVEEKSVTLARALSETRTAASRAVMIGDRAHDVRAGRACRTQTIGVLWGAGDRDELARAGADHIVTTPQELDRVVRA